MSTPVSKERILELLTALGESADDVAASLQTLGIRGEHRNPRACPIAAYLNSYGVGHLVAFERSTYVYATMAYAHANDIANSYWYDIKLLQAVREFLCRFDSGQYPQCERV